MSRNDAFLYTGQNSKSKRLEDIQARKNDMERLQAEVLPHADRLLKHVDDEKQAIAKQLLDYVHTDRTEEDYKNILIALKLYDSYLSTFRLKVQSIVRHGKYQKETTNE